MSWLEQRPSNPRLRKSLSDGWMQAASDAEPQAPFDNSQRAEFDILVCGAVYIDYLLLLDHAPKAARSSRIAREVRRAGGFGWNCAAALATWGAKVALVGNAIGEDSNGRAITRELKALPNLSLLSPIREVETPYVVISRAQSSRFRQRLERGETRIEPIALPKARYVVLDTERDKRRLDLETASYLKRHRVPYLVRGSVPKLGQTFDSTLICGDGSGAACLLSGREARFAAAKVHGPRDVLNDDAAADGFAAGIVWARWQGWSFARAIKFASAAASLKNSASGDAWPRLAAIESLVQ